MSGALSVLGVGLNARRVDAGPWAYAGTTMQMAGLFSLKSCGLKR
jgi:hypothetical protein